MPDACPHYKYRIQKRDTTAASDLTRCSRRSSTNMHWASVSPDSQHRGSATVVLGAFSLRTERTCTCCQPIYNAVALLKIWILLGVLTPLFFCLIGLACAQRLPCALTSCLHPLTLNLHFWRTHTSSQVTCIYQLFSFSDYSF